MQPLRPDEPRQLGPYRLIAALGEGGMGRVLLGIAPDGRLVAVKQVHAQFAHDPGFRERFRREVATSRLVSGAYTAAVMDADPEAETPWLASVFVTGPSLKEAGPLPVDSLRHLATGLAAALLDIHRAGLIHRDLKPSNVLLTDDGPRVIDFGIARAVEDGQELTGTGAIIGSPAFMSPEQAGTAPVTPASDVFSFGALMVMAATGQGPFTGTTTAQTLYNVVHNQPDLSAVPPEIRRFVEPCLAKNPAHRPTPAQLLDFLGHVPPGTRPWPEHVHAQIRRQDAEVRTALSLPLPAWQPPPPKPRPAKKRRRWIWAVSAAVLAVALVAGTVTIYRVAQSAKAGRDAPPPLSIQDALTPERLLRADPCKVLDSEYTPDERPVYTHRCKYTGTKGVEFDLVLGDALETTGIRTSPTVIDGQGLLLNDISGGCEAMVRLPTRPQSSVMIYNSSRDGDPCAIAETAMTETLKRLRDPVVDRQTWPGSLLPVDPCSVLDDATAQKIVGAAVKPAPQALRRCEWAAQDTLSISLDHGAPDTEGEEVDLDGVPVRRKETNSSGSKLCALAWVHVKPSAREGDNVRLTYYSATGGDACAKAEEAAKAAIPKLPKP